MKETEDRGKLERIEYRHGMLKKGMKRSSLRRIVLSGQDIPDSIRRSAAEEKIEELGGVYGDRHVEDPLEYDHIKLMYTDDIVEITVNNRGIHLLFTDDERLKRIHRVLVKIEMLKRGQ